MRHRFMTIAAIVTLVATLLLATYLLAGLAGFLS
jgi:hypothetical protein